MQNSQPNPVLRHKSLSLNSSATVHWLAQSHMANTNIAGGNRLPVYLVGDTIKSHMNLTTGRGRTETNNPVYPNSAYSPRVLEHIHSIYLMASESKVE